jgi:hypothetical protein
MMKGVVKFADLFEFLEDVSDGLIHRGEHGRVSAALGILDFLELLQTFRGRLHWGVDGIDSEMQKNGFSEPFCRASFAINIFAKEAMMESMTEDQKAWARSTPDWIYFVFGLAVSTGVAGSVSLFMRKSWTLAVNATCLLAVIVQMVYTMIIAGGLQVMGPSAASMPTLVIVIAAALLWFSWFAKSRSWFGQVNPTVERE